MRRWLYVGGMIAGPVFLGVWLAQALSREGFDPTRHPLSLLSLGELGWIQVANFVVCGLLYVGFGVAARLTLVGVYGVGLVVAGVFTTDPGAGFPPGAPAGRPTDISVHGIVHEVGFGVTLVAWLALCVVLARRLGRQGLRGWMWAWVGAAVATVGIVAWPDLDSVSLRLVAVTAIQSGLLAGLAVRYWRYDSTSLMGRAVASSGSAPNSARALR